MFHKTQKNIIAHLMLAKIWKKKAKSVDTELKLVYRFRWILSSLSSTNEKENYDTIRPSPITERESVEIGRWIPTLP